MVTKIKATIIKIKNIIIQNIIFLTPTKNNLHILIINKGTRFGNHLYFLLQAYRKRNNGIDFYISHVSTMEYWLEVFPELKKMVKRITPPYRKKHHKVMTSYYQTYHKDFTAEELINFINIYLKADILKYNHNKRENLVLHVRRGDFYSMAHINYYGFNQIDYIRGALDLVNLSEIKQIHIATDDIEWCKEHLSFIQKDYHLEMIFPNKEAKDDFLLITRGQNIILSNSTFSYWGAYINEAIYPESCIIAPNFNTMLLDNGKMRQNSKKWKLVDVETFVSK